jgi:MFS family permease
MCIPAGSLPNNMIQPKNFVRALSSRNYRLYYGGQGISVIGTWITRVATSWLVYRLTGSALMLGVTGFIGQLPVFLFAPFAGVLVDRANKHRILLVTQALSMIQSFLLAVLTLTGVITVLHIILLSALQGFINAFDVPGRQAFLSEMIEKKEDIGNAIALNSSMVNSARLLGPSIAGVIIAGFGEGICFTIDGFSYLAVIASLLSMQLRPAEPHPRRKQFFLEFMEGFHYSFGFTTIKAILLLLALSSMMGMSYSVLMPVFASKVLGGGAHTLGFLMSASGLGALIGAFVLASRESVRGLGRWIVIASSMFGLGLMAFSFSSYLSLSLVLLLAVGFGMMVHMAASNTILQTISEERMRGRVMAFYSMAFMGMTPFGNLLAGTLADLIGAQWTTFLGGFVCVAGSMLFLRVLPKLREQIRPIYMQLGIIPQSMSEQQ